MTDQPSAPLADGTDQPVVRRFIVQEQCSPYRDAEWMDDCDQPQESKMTLGKAREWMAEDIAGCRGHGDAYNHRIIERVERVVYQPNPTGQGRADCGAYPGPGCCASESDL